MSDPLPSDRFMWALLGHTFMVDTTGHKWKSERQMTDYGTGHEYIVCDVCGIEHPGEEFLDRIPNCADVVWAEENP